MKPIPAPAPRESEATETPATTATELIKSAPGNYSSANRRSSQPNVQQAYPLLLAASTAVAIVMGWMYITKPVIVEEARDATSPGPVASESSIPAKPGLLPDREKLPGSSAVEPGKPAVVAIPDMPSTAPVHSRFEETNMRVQHILTATSEDGHVSRIDLEVPVLYQSRNLRWSTAEVARANDLLLRLMDYQDQSRVLRSQGQQLLADWNALVGSSIPSSKLRADSPSLPENQDGATAGLGPVDTTTRDAIEIQPRENP